MQAQGFGKNKTFICTWALKHTGLRCLHVMDLVCCPQEWKTLTAALPGSFNCPKAATEPSPFCFYFGAISSSSSIPSSWLYKQLSTSLIIIWIVGMLRNPAQGRFLGGRCFTLSALLIQQRMREVAGREFSQAMRYSRCRERTQPTHSRTEWCLPNPSHAARDATGPLHQPREFLSAGAAPDISQRASSEKSFVPHEHFQDSLPSAGVLERIINTWSLLLAPRESDPSPCQQTQPCLYIIPTCQQRNTVIPLPSPVSGRRESRDQRHCSFPFPPLCLDKEREALPDCWEIRAFPPTSC